MKITGFIINGARADKEQIADKIYSAFNGKVDYKIYESEYEGHLVDLTAQAIEDGCDCVVCIGGDGSINETVNGVLKACRLPDVTEDDLETAYDWEKARRVAIALYPSGTGNDFARSIKAAPDFERLYEQINTNKTRLVDVAHAAFRNEAGQPQSRFFINIADIGLGGEVAMRLKKTKLFINPNLHYMKSIFTTFLSYKKSVVTCKSGDFEWTRPAMSIVAANGKWFGSGMGIAPHAELDDGNFGAVFLGNITVLDYLRYLPTVKKCRKVQHPEAEYHKFTELDISTEKPLPIDMDGEFVGYTPVKFTKLNQRLLFVGEL